MSGPDASVTRRHPRHPRAYHAPALDEVFDLDGLYRLRRAVAAHAGRLGLPQRQIGSLMMVASELATNAVRHGGGVGRLRLWRQEESLYCQVRDRGPGIGDRYAGTAPPDPLALSGRGLWMCRQTCADLIIVNGPPGRPGTAVTAVLRIEPDPPAREAPRACGQHSVTRPTPGRRTS